MQTLTTITFIMIIFAGFWPTLVRSSSVYDFPVAKPGCVDRCGDITIPFPFGTSLEYCYQADSFRVNCNDSHYDPPKLFWQSSEVEITDISLDGQIKVLHYIAKDCYNSSGGRTFGNSPMIRLGGGFFTVNNTANKFTIVGCDAYAYVSGDRLQRTYSTGCMAMCSYESDLTEGSCKGAGCCQTLIPDGVQTVKVELRSFYNYTNVSGFNECGFAFVVEDRSFNFSKKNLTNLMNVKSLPMVVDWAIGNSTCDDAKSNATTYACVSPNSGCHKPLNTYGYRCHCNQGFQGNPYLADHGCKDINECANETLNNCTKIEYCNNTSGDYTCFCPKGYTGDGRGEDGCNKETKNPSNNMKIANLIIGASCGIITLLLAAIMLYLKRRSSQKKRQKFFFQNGGTLLQQKLTSMEFGSPDMVKIFSSSELEKATNGFHNDMIVGQGGFGTVYKGVLPDNRIVAIKRSKRVDPSQIEQFINEVIVLSQINHRNVVRLLGCCLETDAPLLVYEFINNGTLSSHIHNQEKASVFSWGMRLKVAAETAGVLSYLHSAASTPIIHRDVKSDNILLDHTFTAKVSDFGASKLVPLDLTQLSTMVQGTFGYLDPEYMQTNQLTEKSDVYSFGVVLLELLTGRKALSFDRPVEEKNLANFFLSILKQDLLLEILDDAIAGLENLEQVSEVARLARECLNVRGEDRPSMKEVAMELEGMILSGKHSWSTRNAEEMESLLHTDERHYVNVDGNSSSVGYDSIRDHILLPMSGGR